MPKNNSKFIGDHILCKGKNATIFKESVRSSYRKLVRTVVSLRKKSEIVQKG